MITRYKITSQADKKFWVYREVPCDFLRWKKKWEVTGGAANYESYRGFDSFEVAEEFVLARIEKLRVEYSTEVDVKIYTV